MKKLFLLGAVLAAGAVMPASAQDNPVVVTAPGMTVTTAGNGTAVVTPNNNVVTGTTVTTDLNPTGKSLRDMTDEERQAFWNNLPADEKQRIIERRQQMEAARKNPWRKGGLSNNDMKTVMPAPRSTTSVQADPNAQGDDLNARLSRGKAAWDSMTDAQKRQFIEQNQDAIRAAVQPRQGVTVVPPGQ